MACNAYDGTGYSFHNVPTNHNRKLLQAQSQSTSSVDRNDDLLCELIRCPHFFSAGASGENNRLRARYQFLRETDDAYEATLIDLEKTRPLWFGLRDRVRDLEPLLRRAPDWNETDVRNLLAAYLGTSSTGPEVDDWYRRLGARRKKKENRA